MNWQGEPGTESQPASLKRLDQENASSQPSKSANPPQSGCIVQARAPTEIKIGKRAVLLNGKEMDVFTLSLGSETIELLPHKNWGQLDLYKWCMRGKLPGTPAGLDIALDRVKLGGEVVLVQDPDACLKLEKLFADWLALERETLELAKRKAQSKSTTSVPGLTTAEQSAGLRFRVEVDKEGQVHIYCLQGKDTLAVIGLNNPGFQSLLNQGFMRKPRGLKTGALHDWVELDGVLYSFEKGNNDSAALEKVLNSSYLPATGVGSGKEIVVFSNAASSTGFDVQFPAKVGGLIENRRRPLNEETLNLLQDPDHCGLLHKEIVIKLTRPTLIFKQKTSDGGESYLRRMPENQARVVDEDGQAKIIDLSQPVNYLHLSAVELTAVFNHPAINRHGSAIVTQSASPTNAPGMPDSKAAISPINRPQMEAAPPASAPITAPRQAAADPAILLRQEGLEAPARSTVASFGGVQAAALRMPGQETPRVSSPAAGELKPNVWLKAVLERPPIRYDWLRCLLYEKIAAWFGNSREAVIMEGGCWFIQTGAIEQFNEPGFKGIFLTEKGSFGFVDAGFAGRFQEGNLTVGSIDSALKFEKVRLIAAGIGADGEIVFVVADGEPQSSPEAQLKMREALAELKGRGAIVLSVSELMESRIALKVLWTVPADQANLDNPQAIESLPGGTPILEMAPKNQQEGSASASATLVSQATH